MDAETKMKSLCGFLKKILVNKRFDLINMVNRSIYDTSTVLEIFRHFEWIYWAGKHGSRHQSEVSE